LFVDSLESAVSVWSQPVERSKWAGPLRRGTFHLVLVGFRDAVKSAAQQWSAVGLEPLLSRSVSVIAGPPVKELVKVVQACVVRRCRRAEINKPQGL
jgi:hypothetical protein